MDIGELLSYKPPNTPKRLAEEEEDDDNDTDYERQKKIRKLAKSRGLDSERLDKTTNLKKIGQSLPPPEPVKQEDTLTEEEREKIMEMVENEDTSQAETLSESDIKRMILLFEKRALKNQEMRIKFPDLPEKFMESEVELHETIQELHAVALVPDLYPVLVELNAIPSMLELLAHENTDMAVAVVDLLQELTDVDVLHESQDGAEALMDALLAQQVCALLVQNLERMDESVKEEADGVHNTLAIFENLTEFRPEVCVDAAKQGLLQWLLRQQLQNIGVTDIFLEDLGDPQAAGEGAGLGVWKYQGFRNKAKQKSPPKLELYCGNQEKWSRGLKIAEAQNLARRLMDTPANHMTPTLFAENAVDVLTPLGVDVCVHDKAWAEDLKMGSFLSVAKGSKEPPVFLEIFYSGGNEDEKPVVAIGKGVTFDSGGISIKSAAAMDEMRADMGGAACVVGAIYGAASLKMPLNIVGLIPLCENMPSGGANKPGDIVAAMNGKTIQIDNTDAEGRLLLADALCYSEKFNGQFIIDIATLTGAIRIALGNACTGAYTTTTARWKQLEVAGSETGDRFWRMPLWKYYSTQVTDFPAADVNNVSKLKMAGSCTAAAFLKEFAPKVDWMHLDIAGVMGPAPCDGVPYLVRGMTGRPTRALIHLLGMQC